MVCTGLSEITQYSSPLLWYPQVFLTNTIPHLFCSTQRSPQTNIVISTGLSCHFFVLPHTRLSRNLVLLYTDILFKMPWLSARTGTILSSLCLCLWYKVQHALSCLKGGFPSIWHNEIRDLTANLLTEVYNDVCIEAELLPIDSRVLTGASSYTQDGTRVYIAANGFWGGRFEHTFFDVWV